MSLWMQATAGGLDSLCYISLDLVACGVAHEPGLGMHACPHEPPGRTR